MGLPAALTEVGRGQKRPDVRIWSLLLSPQSFRLQYFLHSSPNAGGKHTTEEAVGKTQPAVKEVGTQEGPKGVSSGVGGGHKA